MTALRMRTSPRALVQALALALGTAIVAVIVVGALSGGRGYLVYATFADASGIQPDNDVKIGGVAAGSIVGVTLDRHDHAVVAMALDRGAYPIGTGATASIRPVDLLGEKYIDLTPGDPRHPLASGSMIPLTRTSEAVDLDQVLDVLGPDTRAALGVIINEAGIALDGRGTNFNETLAQLPPALGQAQAVVQQIADDNGTLSALIGQGDRVITSVNGSHDQLRRLVVGASKALTTTASRSQQLASTIRSAPGTLGQLHGTLASLQSTAQALDPAVLDLQAASPRLASTLTLLPSFTRTASRALNAVSTVAPRLDQLALDGTGPLQRLAPTASRVSIFAAQLQPLVSGLDGGGALKALLGFIDGWAGVIENRDALGNVFRVHITLSPQVYESIIARMLGALQHTRPPAVQRTAPRLAPAPTSIKAPPSPQASGQPQPSNPSSGVGGVVHTVTGLVGALSAGAGAALQRQLGAVCAGVTKLLGQPSKQANCHSPAPAGGSQDGATGSQGGPAGLLHYLLGS